MDYYSRPEIRAKRSSLFIFLFLSIGLVFSRSYAQEYKIMGGGVFSMYSKAPAIAWIFEGFGAENPAEYKPGLLAGIGVELFSAGNFLNDFSS